MTEQDKITTEESFLSLGNGYFGICALGGIIWIIMAMNGSPAPAVLLSIGVGMILTGAMVYCGIRLFVGMSHSLRMLAGQKEK